MPPSLQPLRSPIALHRYAAEIQIWLNFLLIYVHNPLDTVRSSLAAGFKMSEFRFESGFYSLSTYQNFLLVSKDVTAFCTSESQRQQSSGTLHKDETQQRSR
jgi:hypothetical protein